MKNMTSLHQVRTAFKQIGYKCQFKTNCLNEELVQLGFKTDDGRTTIGSNVFGRDFYDEHRQAFELLKSFDGMVLADSEQRIKV